MVMTQTNQTKPWDQELWAIWNSKRALRAYYESEYFTRVRAELPKGRTLEIGAGPGFLATCIRCTVVTDVQRSNHIDQVVDAHDMPFERGSFEGVVGVDVLHHLS